MNKLLVIIGPTATGKTDLALKLANKFQGELISADSRQVYKGLDIGTGKMPGSFTSIKKEAGKWIVDEIPIHMYDVASPKKQYNVWRFKKATVKIIKGIHKRGKLPILVGGTGLYIRAITHGFSNLAIPLDNKLRKQLEKLSVHDLQKKLQKLSSKKWKSLNNSDSQNPRRLIRAIELEISNVIDENKNAQEQAKEFNLLKIGLSAPREILYQRVDKGIEERLKQGMIRESEILNKSGVTLKRMKQLGLEYGVLADYISGKIKSVQGDQGLIKIMQNKIHNFVKRQRTWFKKEKEVNWFDITDKDFLSKVENAVSKWYYSS